MHRVPDSPSMTPPARPVALDPAALRRARAHAELTGLEPARAQQVVEQACRQAGGRTVAPVRFWRALHIQLAPLAPTPQRQVHPAAAALSALPIEARCAFLLRLGEDLDVESIAYALDEPEVRARQHLAQATRVLRAQLGSGPGDSRWIEGIRAWLDCPPHPVLEPGPTRPEAGARASAASPSPRLAVWLGLGLLLLAAGATWMAAGPWPGGGSPAPAPTPAPAAIVDPMEQLLSLPPDDFALLGEAADLATIGQLDFLLWRAQQHAD